jgi:hypothetical protein
MEKTNYLTFKDFLNLSTLCLEELSAEQKREVDTWEKDPKYHEYSDKFFGGDYPTHHSREFPYLKNIPEEILAYLSAAGYDTKTISPETGMIQDKHGREAKIGKLIRDKDLLDQWAREQKSSGFLEILITRDAHEVAGMTADDQDWVNDSCMNFTSGQNKHYLQADVKCGTMVAYLKPKHGKPIARVAIKPYVGPGGKVIPVCEPRIYGNASKDFLYQVKKILSDHFQKHKTVPEGTYSLNFGVYDDGFTTGQYGERYDLLISKDATMSKVLAKEIPLTPTILATLMKTHNITFSEFKQLAAEDNVLVGNQYDVEDLEKLLKEYFLRNEYSVKEMEELVAKPSEIITKISAVSFCRLCQRYSLARDEKALVDLYSKTKKKIDSEHNFKNIFVSAMLNGHYNPALFDTDREFLMPTEIIMDVTSMGLGKEVLTIQFELNLLNFTDKEIAKLLDSNISRRVFNTLQEFQDLNKDEQVKFVKDITHGLLDYTLKDRITELKTWLHHIFGETISGADMKIIKTSAAMNPTDAAVRELSSRLTNIDQCVNKDLKYTNILIIRQLETELDILAPAFDYFKEYKFRFNKQILRGAEIKEVVLAAIKTAIKKKEAMD